MSYNKGLAEWLREVLVDMPDFAERKMFGDLRLMLSGNMCCGIIDEALMTRVGLHQFEGCLTLPHAREMEFTGKRLKGMIYIGPNGIPDGIPEDEDLQA